MTTTIRKTQVDLAGLMRVLGEALYSTPFVAIRELVQNAHDSCVRRKLEARDEFAPAISVRVTDDSLSFIDNGAGLTVDEIHAYLATVGTGYTRALRDQGAGEGLIGYFGLGFLSAFAVSDRVEVWTCSYRTPDQAHRFVSRSGETYSVERAESRPIGTEVRLTLKPGLPELADADVVLAWLRRYCSLLIHPVDLNGGEPVNADSPPWRRTDLSPLRRRTLSLEFASRFEPTFAPMTTITVDVPDAQLSGLIWVQDGSTYSSSDNRNVGVFVRGMLISDEERDLLPRWAGFVGAVIESAALQPTASRESLKQDAQYDRVAEVLRQRLIDGLREIATNDAATWRRVLGRHNEALLGAALADEGLFDLMAEQLTVPTTEGDLTLPALLARGNRSVYLTQEERVGFESILMRALKQPIVLGRRFGAAPFCARYLQKRGGKLVSLGTDTGDRSVFRDAVIDEESRSTLESGFSAPDRKVQVCTFEPAHLPFALITDREAMLKRRIESDEADRRIGQAVLGLARQFTRTITADAPVRMYLNHANPVIRMLPALPEPRRQRALAMLQPLIAMMSDAVATDMERAMQMFCEALTAELETP
jgi:molecular chaperone HtpG